MHADGAARMPAAEGARFVALGRGVPVHGPRGCCSPVRRALGRAGPAHLQGEHKCSSERGGRDLHLHPDDGKGVCRGDEENHGHVRPQGVEGHERQEALACCPSCVPGHGRPAPLAPPGSLNKYKVNLSTEYECAISNANAYITMFGGCPCRCRPGHTKEHEEAAPAASLLRHLYIYVYIYTYIYICRDACAHTMVTSKICPKACMLYLFCDRYILFTYGTGCLEEGESQDPMDLGYIARLYGASNLMQNSN